LLEFSLVLSQAPLKQMVLRRATASDAPFINQLMRECSAYRGEYSAILEGYLVTAEQLAVDEVYVLENAKEILGFYSLTNVKNCPELDLMFVADESQGKHIGTALFEHMKREAASLGAKQVKIVAHPPAEGFYMRMGAKKIGVKKPSGRVSWSRPILSVAVQSVA